MQRSDEPVLWHIPFSHYNEKARWALDYKGVASERRQAPGGMHVLVSLWKTRGRANTFPLLVIDGEAIADSTAIIAALERRFPQPPLYPADPAERKRALELEDFFDEELAPYVRRLVFHEVIRDPKALATFAEKTAASWMPRVGTARIAAAALNLRFGTRSDAAAEECKGKILTALDRLEAELGDGEYLVGDRFTVADLAAASLFYPLVLPPESPKLPVPIPDPVLAFRDGLGRRAGFDYVKEIFRRHRLERPRPAVAAPLAVGAA